MSGLSGRLVIAVALGAFGTLWFPVPLVAVQDPGERAEGQAPFERRLQGVELERVNALWNQIADLEESGDSTRATALAREVLVIRKNVQGDMHWMTVDARWKVQELELISGRPPDEQEEYRDFLRRGADLERLDRPPGRAARSARMKDLRERLRQAENLFGPEHPRTVRVERALVWSLHLLAQYREAEAAAEHLSGRSRRLLGEEHPFHASVCTVFGRVLAARGRASESESQFRKAMAIYLRVRGPESADTAASYNDLAASLRLQSRYDEAEEYLRKALVVYTRLAGEDSQIALALRNNLASLLTQQGKQREARDIHRDVLEKRLASLGEKHPEVALSYNNLAYCLLKLGEYEEARELFERSLALRIELHGERHPHVADSHNNLGLCLDGLGKHEAAEGAHRKSLRLRRELFGPAHPLVATGLSDLAESLSARGSYARAHDIFERALRIRRYALGDGHESTAQSYNNLAVNLDRQGKHAEAAEAHRASIAIYASRASHPGFAEALNNFGVNLANRGRYAESRRQLERALVIAQEHLGPEHHVIAMISSNLGGCLQRQGDTVRARELFERALAVRRRVFGAQGVQLVKSYFDLAELLQALREYSEAERFFERALAVCTATLGERHPRVARLRHHLAWCLFRQGRLPAAEEQLLRAVATFERSRLSVSDIGLERGLTVEFRSPFLLLSALLARRNSGLEAWTALERNSSRGLLDDLSNRARASEAHGEARQPPEREAGAAGQVSALASIQRSLRTDEAIVGWLDIAGASPTPHIGAEHFGVAVRASGDPVWVRLEGAGRDGAWLPEDDALVEQIRHGLSEDPAAQDGEAVETLRLKLARQRFSRLLPVLGARDGLPAVEHIFVLPSVLRDVPAGLLVPEYRVSHAPSASVLEVLRKRRSGAPAPPSRSFFALANPSVGQEVLSAVPERGLTVLGVQPESNAARNGIVMDDVLLEYSGSKLAKIEDLRAATAAVSADTERVTITLWRRGATKRVDLAPGRLGVRLDERSPRVTAELLRGAMPRGFVELPGSDKEVAQIRRSFSGKGGVTVLTGAEASEARLQSLRDSGDLSTYRYLHFATHGVPNRQRAFDSELILSQVDLPDPVDQMLAGKEPIDGKLTAREVLETWELEADMVVLSACETAIGRYAGGEGYLGFAQAFLLAGAQSVVLSLWKVDDRATALLMTRFYENLLGKRAGLEKPLRRAEALREAQHWLRDLSRQEAGKALASRKLRGLEKGGKGGKGKKTPGARPFAHPYYWAAFILVGDPG